VSNHVGTRSQPRPRLGAPGAEQVERALATVREAPGILLGLRLADDLLTAVAGAGPSGVELLDAAAHDAGDQLTAIAAVRALGLLRSAGGEEALVDLVASGPRYLREHAAAALGEGTMSPGAVAPLVAMVARGGFGGMVAQQTLERWGAQRPDAVGVALSAAAAVADRPDARARLVETLGLVPGPAVAATLARHALDTAEAPAVRAAAVAALGDRRGGHPAVLPALAGLAAGDDLLAAVARTALHDVGGRAVVPRPGTAPRDGLTVVQLFLHADLDAELTNAGRGDNGGIATLLVQLGDALVAGADVSRVVTLSRGGPSDGTAGADHLAAPGHHFARVPLWGTPPHQAHAWPLRVAARRGIRRILRAAMPVDVLHLRMADVGSMVAAEAARELGIPVVFTLAPDPHALVAAREAAGTLDRASFGEADHVEHLVLRDRLVRGLADEAAHLVLFPRPDIERDVGALLGVDLADPTLNATVVAEGVDLAAIDRARTAVATHDPHRAPPPHLADLDDLLSTLPEERRHLPLAVTVGRLHPVKGVATLVETWAQRRDLGERCNLLVVGGALDAPSVDEAGELDRIAAAVPPEQAAARGLLLAGHRPHAGVAVWLAAARLGRPGLAAPDGVYVSASLKEEFGIAILEAMSAGLVVVAPDAGGPATYVDEGVTGVLADTTSPAALAEALTRALDLASDADAVALADLARSGLRDRFGIDTMASALARVYASVSTPTAPATPLAALPGGGR
jgi:glycosyltransferase involved in cell wall biosynthesis